MTNSKFIRKLLHLRDVIVKEFKFANYGKELHLYVQPHKCGAQCPECGRRCKIIREMEEERSWRDLVVSGTSLFFHFRLREIICPTHGRSQENIPWADLYSRVSYRLEYLVLAYSQIMTQKAAAKTLNIPKSTFSRILHSSINRIRDGHRIRGLKSIGIDEISYCKGKKYATVVYDMDKGCVVWVSKGKGRETIDTFFEEELSEYQRNQIKYASCDMSPTYIGAIKEYCENAVLVLDKFHIVKALNDAVDEVRKEEWRQLEGEEKKALKGLRWLLFRHSRNRTKGQTRFLNKLKKSNRRIHRAWVLKDEFEAFWEYLYQGSAEKFIKGWVTAVKRSRLEPMKGFVNTLINHWDNIITYVGTPITNAMAEGLNRVIRQVKNRASGYRNFHAFTDMIYLVVGDINIPERIPAKFRTLKNA
jgi:transposase